MSSEEDSNSMTGRRKWFLRGIISTGATCNSSWSGPDGIQTDIYHYLHFIYESMITSGLGAKIVSDMADALHELSGLDDQFHFSID